MLMKNTIKSEEKKMNKLDLRLLKLLGEEDYRIFKLIYKEFEKKPFFELWTDTQILQTFRDILTTGQSFSYDEKGLMNIQFNSKRSEELPYDRWGNFIYLSDLVVLESARQEGIGSGLLDYLIEWANVEDYNTIYFRTNLEGSMSESLGTKRGFEVVTNNSGKIITTPVSFLRQNGKEETDIRKYLKLTL